MAKGDPHGGHLRPELVSPVPPVPRRDIIPETRRVSYLPAARSRRSLSLKLRLNFIRLANAVGGTSGQECPVMTDKVQRKIPQRRSLCFLKNF